MLATPSPQLRTLGAHRAPGAARSSCAITQDGTETRTKIGSFTRYRRRRGSRSASFSPPSKKTVRVSPWLRKRKSRPAGSRRSARASSSSIRWTVPRSSSTATANSRSTSPRSRTASPVRGVVYAPAKNRLFVGETPGGAFEIEASVDTMPDLGPAAARSRCARRRRTD